MGRTLPDYVPLSEFLIRFAIGHMRRTIRLIFWRLFMSTQTHTHPLGDDFVIGFHIGPFGRYARLIFALYFLVFFVVNPLVLNSQPLDDFLTFALETLGWVVAIAAIYMVSFYFLGELLLSKMNPWTGTLFFLGLPTLIGMLGYMPQPIQIAFGLYVPLSLILIFFMRYGGCEVVALPSLIFRKRFTMYCPYNAMDAIEAGVTAGRGSKSESFLALASMTITLFVGSWFLFVENSRLLSRYGVDWHIDKSWALLLVIPTLHLAYRALTAYRGAGTFRDKAFLRFGLGGLILGLYMLVFFGIISFRPLWLTAMVMGGLYVLFEAFQFLTGRKKFAKKEVEKTQH
jgi:Family of unknown function (DUF6410)